MELRSDTVFRQRTRLISRQSERSLCQQMAKYEKTETVLDSVLSLRVIDKRTEHGQKHTNPKSREVWAKTTSFTPLSFQIIGTKTFYTDTQFISTTCHLLCM